ncbi:hypothetical protein JCM10213_006130 [Rhodosporidiobolus nylandii]
MTANETGECCVCGQETSNRCGACAEADFSLFFCSREHQKLIWPVHKRVCGPLSTLCLHPFLESDEALDAKQHIRTTLSTTLFGTASLYDWLRFCDPSITPAQVKVRPVPLSLSPPSGEREGSSPDPPAPQTLIERLTVGSGLEREKGQDTLLTQIRSVRWARLNSGEERSRLEPFDALAFFDMMLTVSSGNPNNCVSTEPWLAGLRHKALILFTLVALGKKAKQDSQLQSHCQYAYEALKRYVRVEVAQEAGPQMAKGALQALDEVVPPPTGP